MSGSAAVVASDPSDLIVAAVCEQPTRFGRQVTPTASDSPSWGSAPPEAVFIAVAPPDVPRVVDAMTEGCPKATAVLLSSPAAPFERSAPADQQWFLPAEKYVQASGLTWTIVRPVGLMAATLAWRPDILSSGVVRHPYGQAAYPHVHEADVGAVAAAVMVSRAHAREKLTITGPESITPVEQVLSLGTALGRRLEFEELSPTDAAQRWRLAGWDEDSIELELALLADYVDDAPRVRDTVERFTASPGLTFDRWATDHVDDFR